MKGKQNLANEKVNSNNTTGEPLPFLITKRVIVGIIETLLDTEATIELLTLTLNHIW